MGKSISSAQKIQQLARIINPNNKKQPRHPTQLKPVTKTRPISSVDPTRSRPDSRQLSLNGQPMDAPENSERRQRTPLAEVVADCVKRWFQDTLKEAKNGDNAMQVLVGQMYYSGYGIERDPQKGRAWINRASKSRSSVWKVGDKHPGYNASDSDSDDAKEEAK